MTNKHILFIHPIVSNITFEDLIQDLNIIITDLSFFQSITINILRESSCMSNEDISSLFNYISMDKVNWILYLLKTFNEK